MSVYICPVCGRPLVKTYKVMRCENNHSYDISSKGYVNLLGPGKSVRGDDADMVAARRRFLNSGSYDALRVGICKVLEKIPFELLLDAGCGEGYYTKQICKKFEKAEIAEFKKNAPKFRKHGRKGHHGQRPCCGKRQK